MSLACAVLLSSATRESLASFYSWPVGGGPQAIAAADLNADGRQDLVTANGANTLTVLLNQGGGRFGARQDLATRELLWHVTIADLNADAAPDLVVASQTVSIFLGNGDGTFGPRADYALMGATCVAVADVNGDATPDVLAGQYYPNIVAVFPGAGDGTLGDPAYFPANPVDMPPAGATRAPAPSHARTTAPLRSAPVAPMKFALLASLAAGDLDRDGRPDIAVGLDDEFFSGMLQVLLGDGQGGFGWGPTFWTTGASRAVTLVDFNGDTWADVTAASGSLNAVSLALDPWDGSSTVTYLPVPTFPQGVAAGDLDVDGFVDLVSADYPGEVRVWLGNGSGAFGPPALFATGANPHAVLIADLDGDGRADLATADHDASTVSVLFGDGAGGFGVPPRVGVPSPPLASALTLAPAHPNPIVSAATIRFVLPEDGQASLIVRDAAGRRIARLEDGFLPAGEHVARWDRRGTDGAIVPPGVYSCELRFGGERRWRRIAVLD